MPSNYPGALDNISTALDNTTPSVNVHPAHHNLVAAAINAVQAVLGLHPENGFASVSAALASALSQTKHADLDVISRIIHVGPVTYDFSIPAGGPNSTYVVLDKNNTASDASVYFRDQGAGRSEIGLATDNRLHIKSVTGAAGSEVFQDALIAETNAKVWIPIALGVGTIPTAEFHIGFTKAAAKVISKLENVGNGGVSLQLKTPGGDWSVGADIGQNGGNNFGIQDNAFGYMPRLFIDGSGRVGVGTDAPNAASNLDVRGGTIAIGSGGVLMLTGSGSPEGVKTAPVGSVYHRQDGGPGVSFYVKESGTGNTGWIGYGPTPANAFPSFARPLQPTRTLLVVPSAAAGFNSAGAGGTASDDSSIYARGATSRKLATNGMSGATVLESNKPTGLGPFDIGPTKRLIVDLRSDNWAQLAANTITLYFTPDNYTTFAELRGARYLVGTGGLPVNNEWKTLSFSVDDLVFTGMTRASAGLTAITGMKIQVKDGGVPLNVWWGGVFTEPLAPEASLSWWVDDGFKSAYQIVAPALDKWGYAATFCPIIDQVDVNANYVTTSMLRDLQDMHNWDIAAHAYTLANHNAGYVSIGASAADADMLLNQQWLINNGFRAADQLAYPLGIFDGGTLAAARKRFRLARTTNAGSGGTVLTSNESRYPPDLMTLKCRAITSADTVATLTGIIDTALANKEQLNFLVHDVGGSGQITAANFQTVVDYAQSVGIKTRKQSESLTVLEA